MYKIKLISRGFDGETVVETTPTFQSREGWNEATLTSPVGVLPADLWGQVPPGDPYLVHACLLTTNPLDAQSFFEVQSGPPVRSRVQYMPTPDNTRIALVRPSDRLRVFVPPQDEVKLELLVESIGGTNELGSRLSEWASAGQQARDTGVRIARFKEPAELSAWVGTIHVIYDAQAAGNITLPIRQLVPTSAVLTITRAGAGVPTLVPLPGDELAGGINGLSVFRSAFVMNNGEQWTFAGS